MAAAKIKKGDSVVVLSGKDKGKTGTVAKVSPKDGKIVVEGVNIAARHRKPTRVRFEDKDGKKVRVAVKSGEMIDG